MDSEENKVVGVEVKVPDCVDKTLESLTAPLAKSAGTTLADLWYLAFGSISTFAEKKRIIQAKALENFKNNLEKRIETIPEDKRVMPDTQIVGGALYDSRFCVDKDELRSMFENLIASSLSSDTASNVHPSFSGIIRQMTCADAQILSKFKESDSLPIVNYQYITTNNGGTVVVYRNVISCSIDGSELERESRSLDYLKAIGLIDLNYGSHYVDETRYNVLSSAPFFKQLGYVVSSSPESYPNLSGTKIEKGIASLTDLGKQFVSICIS